MIPTPYRYALAAAFLVGVYGTGYAVGRQHSRDEVTAIEAVAIATNSKFRNMEQEVKDAQAAHVKVWTASRDASRAEWLRIRASSAGRVPKVCAEPGGSEELPGDGLESARATADRVLHDAVGALERADEVSRTLEICQSELRQCAGLR